MKKITCLFALLLFSIQLLAQNELLVTAKNGLNIRVAPNLNSEKLGKFNYAEKVTVLEKTNQNFEIIDNNTTIKGAWFKVKGTSTTNNNITGYVFSGFLSKPPQTNTFEFISYNDDGDYTFLKAKKGKTYYFINDKITDRSYVRGDIIEIKWKEDIIYVAGDGETKEISEWIISTKKVKDGNVSNFRKNYTNKIGYYDTYGFSQSFLDDLYLIVEYYVVHSKNKLIKELIKTNKQIEFLIEKTKRNNEDFITFGIGHSNNHRVNTIQWLYYNNRTEKLYEYDIANDKLIEFKE